jgi:hypothetical protein
MTRAPALGIVIAVLVVLGAAITAAACGKRAADPDAPTPRKIGALATVDAPPAWEVASVAKDAYRVGVGPGEQVFVREVAFPPKALDELYATECARALEPGAKSTTPHGALIVECRLASTTKDGASIELLHVASLLRAGDRGIKCHFGLSGDAAAATAVCRSLRP